jgi:hypothetical protein
MLRRIAAVSCVLLISASGASALERPADDCHGVKGAGASGAACQQKVGSPAVVKPGVGASASSDSTKVADSNIIGRNPPPTHQGHFPLPGPIHKPPHVSPN